MVEEVPSTQEETPATQTATIESVTIDEVPVEVVTMEETPAPTPEPTPEPVSAPAPQEEEEKELVAPPTYDAAPGELVEEMIDESLVSTFEDERGQELYLQVCAHAKNMIRNYNRTEWKKDTDKKGHYIGYIQEKFENPKGKLEKLYGIRSEVVIQMTPEEVHEILFDWEHIQKFDQYIESFEHLEESKGDLCVSRCLWKKFLVISRRETIILSKTFKFSNGIIMRPASSVTHDDAPIVKDPVRATVYLGGWILIPENDGKHTRCVYFNASNPNGSIPGMFKTKAQFVAGGITKTIRDYMHKLHGIKKA